ncbi:hypothetical protein VPH35_133623 [Triticum aestivum]
MPKAASEGLLLQPGSVFAQGTHRFDIVGYSAAREALGGSVRSGSFSAGGFLWAIICRLQAPNPAAGQCGLASISLELSKNDTSKDVVAMASLRIDETNGTGQSPAAVWRSQEAKTFGARSMSAVAWELAVPEAFQNHESCYVIDDCLTIHCTVEVLQQQLQQQDSTAIKNCLVLVPPVPSICQDFYNLLRERRSPEPDVTFILEDDGTEVQAHKLLLAMRSPVFCAQRRCLVAMAQDLLVAADLYDLERLRLMCEKVLSESIDVGNVMTTLMLAQGRHSCQQLEASCIEFMVSDPDVYDTVEATEEYKELEKTCPSFINDITKKVAKTAVSRHRSPSSTNNGSKMTTRSVSKYTPSVMMSGTHEFTIQCLSAMRKTHGVGQYIRSGSFQVGGYEWTIEVFPSGYKQDITDSISIYIRPFIHDDDTKVEASVTLKPIDPTGELPPFPRRNFMHVYAGTNCEGWGWPKFIIAKYANTHYVGHDGSFTVQCQVEVPTESRTSSTIGVGTVMTVPPSNMAWHLEQLLVREEGSDVKFLVEDIEICSHGLVIATRSPVLHEAVESASGRDHVRIDGIRAMAFKAMLHFIYTDELPRVDDLVHMVGDITTMAGEMLVAACRFRLERMKRLCINLLAEKVTTVLSALNTAKVARRHNCPELEEYCRQYMLSPHMTNKVTETCINLFLES